MSSEFTDGRGYIPPHAFQMVRIRTACELAGLSKSTLYNSIQDGVFPSGILFSSRLTLWPANEIERVNRARVAGYTNDQIRTLVAEMLEMRKHALDEKVAA